MCSVPSWIVSAHLWSWLISCGRKQVLLGKVTRASVEATLYLAYCRSSPTPYLKLNGIQLKRREQFDEGKIQLKRCHDCECCRFGWSQGGQAFCIVAGYRTDGITQHSCAVLGSNQGQIETVLCSLNASAGMDRLWWKLCVSTDF